MSFGNALEPFGQGDMSLGNALEPFGQSDMLFSVFFMGFVIWIFLFLSRYE
jgi:hypothetical protein